jgi:hypothetical protein
MSDAEAVVRAIVGFFALLFAISIVSDIKEQRLSTVPFGKIMGAIFLAVVSWVMLQPAFL